MVRSHASTAALAAVVLAAVAATLSAADWPGFRGPARDGMSGERGLYRTWPAAGPRVLWKTTVADGYAGAAIRDGVVYVNDYDMVKKAHLVRAISLATGKDVWQWSSAVDVRPNHGITRTVPSVTARHVFSLDPKCRFFVLDVKTGSLVWQKNLVQEYKATIPGWYAGQNPLLDMDRVVLATGGDALAVAFEQATGKEIWRTPNPERDVMSHASLMPAMIGGVKQYLYLTMNKVVGIAADDGRLLWKIPFAAKMAACPSPLAIGDGRIFITSGYEAGSTMIEVQKGPSGFTARRLYDLTSAQFNSEVHTPVLFQNHLFGVGSKSRGRFTCLSLDGKVVWQSPVVAGDAAATPTFELGGYLLADGMFFVLDGRSGMLRLIEASTTQYKELASARVLSGEEVWGPMALSNGRLVIRDMSQMICLQVGPVGAK